ncbi:unnamed protein product [Paramecium octaurelia]|uniref:Uncharacterized protein n=1 Tax=Paramecium octaurelia TaxID=43137 RepID=A0A8S1V168_PAROT|nr:unnamed protein product [Paramecium octaurelia]
MQRKSLMSKNSQKFYFNKLQPCSRIKLLQSLLETHLRKKNANIKFSYIVIKLYPIYQSKANTLIYLQIMMASSTVKISSLPSENKSKSIKLNLYLKGSSTFDSVPISLTANQ